MLLMTTGDGAESERMSGLTIAFTVPAGVSAVNFTYLYLSDEFPDAAGDPYADRLFVLAHSVEGSVIVVEEYSDGAVMTESQTIYGGETTWRNVSVDVSALAGTADSITLSMLIGDVAGNDVDSAVLIDNLHFDDAPCDNEQLATGK
jgi:hypothetical protein